MNLPSADQSGKWACSPDGAVKIGASGGRRVSLVTNIGSPGPVV